MSLMSQQAEPLVIDVDTGIDDALALLYACAAPEAEIVGVSTVVGNVSLSAATRNTRAVLALAGRADIPVWPGASMPDAPVTARIQDRARDTVMHAHHRRADLCKKVQVSASCIHVPGDARDLT